MLQLVYTSAPRLMEAGKTGFGTVACSRDLPGVLVSHLERLSTFDRQAGVSSYVFYSLFEMGDLAYRVFSRVGDSGVDYTRRTNHVAHHLVVCVGSPEDNALSAYTPAAVLQSLESAWIRSWNEQPQYLEEMPLPVMHPVAAGAWLRATGDADNARWLNHESTEQGAYFIGFEDEQECLQLLHEGFALRADSGWNSPFTTAAVGSISSNICPIICLPQAQVAAGVRPRGYADQIFIAPGLTPPELFMTPDAAPDAEVSHVVSSTKRKRKAESRNPKVRAVLTKPTVARPKKTHATKASPFPKLFIGGTAVVVLLAVLWIVFSKEEQLLPPMSDVQDAKQTRPNKAKQPSVPLADKQKQDKTPVEKQTTVNDKSSQTATPPADAKKKEEEKQPLDGEKLKQSEAPAENLNSVDSEKQQADIAKPVQDEQLVYEAKPVNVKVDEFVRKKDKDKGWICQTSVTVSFDVSSKDLKKIFNKPDIDLYLNREEWKDKQTETYKEKSDKLAECYRKLSDIREKSLSDADVKKLERERDKLDRKTRTKEDWEKDKKDIEKLRKTEAELSKQNKLKKDKKEWEAKLNKLKRSERNRLEEKYKKTIIKYDLGKPDDKNPLMYLNVSFEIIPPQG